MLRHGFAFMLGGLAMASGVMAHETQNRPDPTISVLQAFESANAARTALPAFEKLQQVEVGDDAGASSLKQELMATLAAQLGAYDMALSQYPRGTFKASLIKAPARLPDDGFHPADAVTTIAALAKDRRVVIINEAHHLPQTRGLVAELLPRLRAQGFTDYAIETLGTDAPQAIEQRGHAVQQDGFYTREPVFGQLIRSAAALGYRFSAHEYMGDEEGQQARETGQARNLAKLLQAHPDARVLVHAGYSHAREATYLGHQPMAAELKRLTGIDPLTVDQTIFEPGQPRSREPEGYRSLLARLPESQLTGMVFVDGQGKPWSYEPAQYDVSVILPDPPSKDGRPGWLWQPALQRHAVPADATLCAGTFPCAVAARWQDASDDAVPADSILLPSAKIRVWLALPPGHFNLVATDARDRILGARALAPIAP